MEPILILARPSLIWPRNNHDLQEFQALGVGPMQRPHGFASCTDPKHRYCGLALIDSTCQPVTAAKLAAMIVGP